MKTTNDLKASKRVISEPVTSDEMPRTEREELIRWRWHGRYRDARMLARISCNALDKLVRFRGFGILKTVHATDFITHVGRLRVDDVRSCDWIATAKAFNLSPKDYNPSRILHL